jgi:hypothetical protein
MAKTRYTNTRTGTEYWGDFDQRHLLNVHGSYRLSPRMNASARFRYASNMPVPDHLAEPDGRLVLAPTRKDL